MVRPHFKLPVALLLLAFLFTMTGCNEFLAEHMVLSPNSGAEHTPSTKPTGGLRIVVGPPDAIIAAWILEPTIRPKGTILVLHGFLTDHYQVLNSGKALRDAGYRTVMVDLRGHGQSTGKFITFGYDDTKDLEQVITYLQQHRLCGRTVGVFGTSYGAACSILLAGDDPRVKAVVAVAPFATLREEAPYFAKHLIPIPGLFMSDQDYITVINKMGKVAGFDPDACSPLVAIKKTTAPIRLFQGTDDLIVSPDSSRELAAAAPDHTQLTMIPGIGHLALVIDTPGRLHAATKAWFDKYLATPISSPALRPTLATGT
jgi:hypothetical protein